eukprot:IDg2610t1
MMSRDFSVEFVKKLSGKYTPLLSYYAKHRLGLYIEAEYMYEELAGVAFADFEIWTDKEFKRIDASLQRDLRDHFFYNRNLG